MLLEITEKYAGALSLSKVAGLLMYTAGVLILIFQRVFPDRSNVGAYSCNNGRLSARAKAVLCLLGSQTSKSFGN